MNEFWAIVIGAGLATIGGIIGTAVTYYFQKRNENKKAKKEAYIKILEFCNSLNFYNTAMKQIKLKEISEALTVKQLYGSDTVKELFDVVMHEIFERKKDENDGKDIDYVTTNKKIKELSEQIKKELDI